MAKSFLIAAFGDAVNDNTTEYTSVSGPARFQPQEDRVSMLIPIDGTIDNLKTYVSANTTTTATTVITTRNNAADTSLTVSYTAGQTGQKEDLIHSAAISADDLLTHEIAVANNAGSTSIAVQSFYLDFDSDDSNALSLFSDFAGTGDSYSSATTLFGIVGRGAQYSTTEADSRLVVSDSYIASDINGWVSSNSRSGTSILRSRVNGSDGNQSVTWTTGQTGVKHDTSNTDSLVDGDFYCHSLVIGAGSGNIDFRYYSSAAINSDGRFIHTQGQPSGKNLASTSFFGHLNGLVLAESSVEAYSQIEIGFDVTASEVSSYVNSNTSTGTSGMILRINGSNSSLGVSYGSGETGVKTDTDTILITGETDLLNWGANEAGTGTITITRLSVEFYINLPNTWIPKIIII